MSSLVHPDMAPILDARRFVTEAKTPAEKRRNWTVYSNALAVPVPPSIVTRDLTIPVPGHDVPVRIYTPRNAAGLLPCVIYMHGGGFMMGDLDSSDTTAWGFCEGAGAIVVSVDYRLTPEHPFPAAFDDCFGVLQHLAAHGSALGIDGTRIALAGDSAGGNLAAALSLASRDRHGPAVRAQAVIYPSMCEPATGGSFVENANSPSLTTSSIIIYNSTYTSGEKHANDPYASPTKAKSFAGLPPTIISTGELDPIRDDGRHYASKLALGGTSVTYREVPGFLHGFLRVRLTGALARAEFAAVTDFLRGHLA